MQVDMYEALLPGQSTHSVNFKLDWGLGNRNKVNHLSLFWMATLPFLFHVCISLYLHTPAHADNCIFQAAGVKFPELPAYVSVLYIQPSHIKELLLV